MIIGSKQVLSLVQPPDILKPFKRRIFKEIYDDCKEKEGTFYFKDDEEAICLKSSTGIIDFSNSTEIVGKNFSRNTYYYRNLLDKPFEINENNELEYYHWPLCDSNSPEYNFDKCMSESSWFRTFENPAGLNIIMNLIYDCMNMEGNAFYYSNNSNNGSKYEYVCVEERPLDYFDNPYVFLNHITTSSKNGKKLPKNCMIKDNQYVCGRTFKIKEREACNSENCMSVYEGDFFKDLFEAVAKSETMKKIDLNPIDYSSKDKRPSLTTLVAQDYHGYLTSTIMSIPENVNKMLMTCKRMSFYFGDKNPQTVKASDYVFDVLDYYTTATDQKTRTYQNTCYVFTQRNTPMTSTVMEDFCKTVPTYIPGPTPTYTVAEHCETLTLRKNKEPEPTEEPEPTIECHHGYPCCSECGEVFYVDSDASWSIENDDWCELLVTCPNI